MARVRRFPRPAELKKTLTPATPWAERDRLKKTSRVNLRVAPEERAEMAAMAEAFGMDLSAYLLRLHRLTVSIQGGERRVRVVPKGGPL